MQFSWTVAGRKVKLELKKEQDPAAINRNVFDLILEKVERLEAEQAEAEVSHAQHLPSRQNLDALQKQNALKRLFTESQYTLTHFGPQNSFPIGPEFNALKPPPRHAQRTFVFGSSKNVISHINPEISQLETVCGPRQASCCNSVKDASFIHPSDFTFLGSQRSHLIEPPDTGIHCNKRPYSHCLQTTTNGDQELAFNHNKRRGTVTEEQATQVCEQPCEGGGQVVLGDDIMRLLNCLTQLPAKVGAESARYGDRVLPNFKLARAPPVKDSEAHVIENREIGNVKKTNVGLKKGVSTNEALNLVDGLVSNACDVRSVPFRVSHGHTKDDAIVVSDSDNEDQEDDRRVPPLQSKESDRKGQEVQRGKKIGDESSGYRAVRGEGDWPNTVRCKEEDEGVPGNVPVERVVARIGDIDNMGSWSERQPLVTLQKYQKKLGIHNCAEASKGAGAGAEEQNIDSSLKEGTIPSSFHTGFRGVRESTAGKWSTWLKEAKSEFQEGTSWECLGRRDTEPRRELEESAKVASSGKGGVTTQANSLEILPICKVHENHKVCLKTTVEALDLSNNTAYPAAKVPSTRNNHERLQTVNQRASIREDVSSRPFPTGVMKLNGVKVELVAEFCTEGQVEGNKEWKEGLQDEPEHISDDDVEEVPHMGHTSAQKLRNSSAKTVKSSQNECNGSQKAPGVLHQEHKKRGRPCSVAKRQAHAAKYTSPDAGAHTKFATQDSQSESSDDDASIIEVKLDKSLHQEFQDGDYYKFEDDRAEERIKKDQIWALYDELDDMPRTWVRIMKVSRKPSFRAWFRWLEPINLTLQERQWEQTNGYSPSCGEFKDGKDGRCNTITIFSHQMSVNALPNGHVQIYPNEGEVWAFHRNRNKSAAEKNIEKEGGGSEKPNGTDSAKEPSFRLVEILSSPGCGRSPEVQALGKLPGFRTFWAPAYKRGHLPPKHMHYFSHRVPAYRMTGNERMDVPPNCWDIDPAAIPKWESKVT